MITTPDKSISGAQGGPFLKSFAVRKAGNSYRISKRMMITHYQTTHDLEIVARSMFNSFGQAMHP